MKDLLTVAEFTIKDMLTRKSFIISMIVILVMIVVGFNIPNIMNAFNKEGEVGKTILIIDNENIFENSLEVLNSMELGYKFEIQDGRDAYLHPEIEEKIANGDIESCIKITKTEQGFSLEYITESVSMFSTPPEYILESFREIYKNVQITKVGLTEEQISKLNPQIDFSITQTNENASNRKSSSNDDAINGIILRNLLLCISGFKFNNNRKNI